MPPVSQRLEVQGPLQSTTAELMKQNLIIFT